MGLASGILQKIVVSAFPDFQDFLSTTFDNILVLCDDYADAKEELEKAIHRAYEYGLVLKIA